MGWDTVNFTTTSTNNNIYNTWLNRVKNGNTKSFKEFLLSSDENLQLFAKNFDGYQEGDMFVKQSVVELQDGRLLCFDADEAKAYIIDLENISSTSERFNMTIVEANDTTLSYDKQIENIIKQIRAQIGDSKMVSKDGTKLDESYITSNILSSNSLAQYQEAIGLVTNSETGETTTTIDSKNLNKIYYTNISQMSTDEDEQAYYINLLTSLGLEVDSSGNINDNDEVFKSINEIISTISKNLNPSTLTLANQSRLNLLELFRKLSISEIELIEKMNPGLLDAVGNFIGTYQGTTYTDQYGNRTQISSNITWSNLMQEKNELINDPLAYLKFEDRMNINSVEEQQFDFSEGNVNINGQACNISNISNGKIIINGKEYNISNGKMVVDGEEYDISDGKMTIGNNTEEINNAKITMSGLDYIRCTNSQKAAAIENLSQNQNRSSSSISMQSYFDNTQSQGVSDYIVSDTIADFNTYFDRNGNCTQPDEALMFLAELRDPELAYKMLSDSGVQEKIKKIAEAKGTLSGGKGQTPLMYYIDETTGQVACDENGNLLTAKMNLNVVNVAQHLNILTQMYKASRCDENGNYIAGDNEKINDSKNDNAIQSLLNGLTSGENVKHTTTNATVQGWTAGVSGTTAAGAAIVGWIQSARTAEITIKGSSDTLKGIKAARALINGNSPKSFLKIPGLSAAGATTIAAGAALGGAVGNYIGDQIIKNDTSGDFIDQNGNFRDGKATTFKTFTTITGIGAGAAVGSGVALALGLVSNPVGWTVLVGGAVLGIVCGLVSWAIKEWA